MSYWFCLPKWQQLLSYLSNCMSCCLVFLIRLLSATWRIQGVSVHLSGPMVGGNLYMCSIEMWVIAHKMKLYCLPPIPAVLHASSCCQAVTSEHKNAAFSLSPFWEGLCLWLRSKSLCFSISFPRKICMPIKFWTFILKMSFGVVCIWDLILN